MNFDAENKVYNRIINEFKDDKFINSTTGKALIGVYNYANISSVSIFPEEKFMNLWISIESFMKTGQYDNIISHIKEVLPAVMCKRYIYRLIRNFAEDCKRSNVYLNFYDEEINYESLTKKEVVKYMIDIIKDDVKCSKLKKQCEVNQLLSYRLNEMIELCKSNITVIQKLRRYYQTVSWHVQRLYRVRNEIAHSAMKESNNIALLIEHLYDYLAVLISEIIYAYTEKGIKSIDMIFPYLKDNYDVFNSILEKNGHCNIKEFVLIDGVIDYL